MKIFTLVRTSKGKTSIVFQSTKKIAAVYAHQQYTRASKVRLIEGEL